MRPVARRRRLRRNASPEASQDWHRRTGSPAGPWIEHDRSSSHHTTMLPAVEDIVAYLDSLKADGFTQDERFKVKEAAQACLNRLQTPFERVWSWGWEVPMLQAACQIFRDVGLWTAWTASQGGEKSLEALCRLASKDMEASLVRRLMKHLGAFGVVQEVGVDRWCPTEVSLALGVSSTDIGQLLQSG